MTGSRTLTMLRSRTRALAAGRLPIRGEDRGSMAMALLVGLIGSGIAALLIPMVVVQIRSTSFNDSRTREMNAAEAGTLVAAGLVRSAVSAQGQGDVTQLPCTSTPLTGTVAGSAGQLSYRVRIGYYTQDPMNQSESWLAAYTGPTGAGHGMRCSQAAGTYLPAGALGSSSAQQVPSWAVITATGYDSRGERTLRSIYTVKTTNANIAGGTIYVWTADPTNAYCMDAESPTPKVGDQVYLEPCATGTGGTPKLIQQQAWAYNADLSIQLVSSVSTDNPYGLCLTAAGSSVSGTESANQQIVLAQCAAVGSAPWNQLWSVDDSAHLRGSLPNKSDTNNLCINVASQSAHVPLTLQSCTGGTTDTSQTWVPSPDAGSGMAGVTSGQSDATPIQYVNFQEFSHCMDVTNHQAAGGTDSNPHGNNFLIAYTCKQNPSPDNVAWNQKFKYVNGELITNDGSKDYCLTSPLSVYASPSTGQWVTVTPCPASPTAATIWRKYDKNAQPEPSSPSGGTGYKYAIQDSNGYCLSITTDSAAAYNSYPKLIVASCDGSKLQMWNGAADVQTPTLTDFSEVEVPVTP